MCTGIISNHKDRAPETYNGGSYPIDEIFVTKGLNISSCGYLEHGIWWTVVASDGGCEFGNTPILACDGYGGSPV